ncbi:MAG: DNA polymerase III subunit gamma/tau, partial [Myxococcales bacterium]|nr:DNA polymerase III subunit gamma/tau [Myxococcales bacterium]
APGAAGTDPGGEAVGGGGGGGGSAGVIKVFSTTPTGTNDLTKVSPRPS